MLKALDNKDRRLKIKAIADAGVDKLKEPMGCSTCKTIAVDWSRLTTTVIWLSINCPCTLQGITCGQCMFPVLGLTRSAITSGRRRITLPT